MKNILKPFALLVVIVFIFSGCSSSKYASGSMHNRGVNNRHYQGYSFNSRPVSCP